VHEAFAEPVTLEVQAGLIVTSRPPADIEEVPPPDRPQGDEFVWVPGYWSWDADRDDFIWVSACWRVGPPDMYWVPGYWAQVTDVQEVERGGVDVRVGGVSVRVGGGRESVGAARWEWVPGFWASAGAQEIEYLPAPPAPVDMGPPGPPPGADDMWVPGCWYWHDGRYVWRPGYWLRQQPDWVWEPSHYCWTPRGYVFVAGHWDYSLERRGVLFAPVYFPRSVYERRGFSYSPTIAVDVRVLSVNLFIYPRYSHYYFGDYYDDAYLRVGIYPQFESERRHTWYDPIYTYDRWHHGRADRQWEEHQRQDYDRRRADSDLRPARTYREMETRAARMPEAQRRDYELAKPLRTIVERKETPLKFEEVNTDARQKIARQETDVHKFREERVKWEAPGATSPPTEPTGPVTPPTEREGRVTPAAEQTPGRVPPREVHLAKPERVKIPVPPPIVGKPETPGDVKKGPPPRPTDEQKLKTEAKDATKAEKTEAKDAAKADVKDTRKDEGDQKNQ